jgi:hypothetical protein
MTLDEVNTTIYQPQRSDYHRGHITEIQSHQLFYYMSKSEDRFFFFTVIVITKNKIKKYAIPQGNS